MAKLCRTCLAGIPDTTYVMLNTRNVKAQSIQAKLVSCVPELQLNLVKDAVICQNCVSSLELAYTFKMRCLLTEKRIQSCIRNPKLLIFAVQPNTETSCSATNSSERRDLSAVRNDDTASNEQCFAKPEILTVDVHSDKIEEDRTKNYLSFTAKEDSNVVVNNDFSKVDTEEANELCNVITNGEISVDSTTHNLECRENILGLPVVTSRTINRYETSQDLHDTEEDAIVKKECEILTVKLEKDEVLNLKKENVNDEEEENESCTTVTLSEVSNLVGADITKESPNVIHDTDTKDLFDRDYESPLSTTEDDIFEENYSSYSNDSYVDAASLADAPANTNINAHKSASVKNWSANHGVERTNNWSTSSSHKLTNPYTVSMDEVHQEMNDTDGAIIVKQEHELETFKTEDCTRNVDLPMKECFVNLDRFPVHSIVLMNKSSCNINELRNSLEDTTKTPKSVREMDGTVGKNLIKNKQTHTDEELFRCKICDFITTTKFRLLEHTQTHKGKKGYRCDVCEYSTPYRQSLVEHMSKHTGNKPFPCTICDYRTARKGDLVRHLIIHNSEKPFRCSTCNHTTTTKTNLVEHLKNHTGEKPFCCDICGHRMRTKQCLITHMTIHTGERPFACDVCGFTTVQKHYLTIHMRTHTKEKPFRCGICKFSAIGKSNLTQHMRTHTKPFRCNVCEYRATRKGNLVKHIRKHAVKNHL